MSALTLSFLLAAAGCGRVAPPAAPAPADAPAPDAAARVSIHYPVLPAAAGALAQALHAYAARQQSEFLADVGLHDPATEDPAAPWRMTLAFSLSGEGRDFVGVLAEGVAYTGGAHGNPLLASFVWHRRSGRVLALGDLFAQPDAALQRLSELAAAALRERLGDTVDAARIADGTAPRAENYAVFLVDLDAAGRARGLRLLFPAYQVAPYAQGLQRVDVPAERFAALLRPEFRAAFTATKKR